MATPNLSLVPSPDKPPYSQPTLAGGGGPPHDVNMEHRITALETRLDTLLPTLATKSDIESAKTAIEGVRGDINRWMLATTLTIIGTVVAAIIGLNTIWKSSPSQLPAPAQQQAPVIIQVPAYPAPQSSAQIKR